MFSASDRDKSWYPEAHIMLFHEALNNFYMLFDIVKLTDSLFLMDYFTLKAHTMTCVSFDEWNKSFFAMYDETNT